MNAKTDSSNEPSASSESVLTAADLDALNKAIREPSKQRFLTLLANLPVDCIYCSLSVQDWPKCERGFPGCARGDDAMMCSHLGREITLYELLNEWMRLEKFKTSSTNTNGQWMSVSTQLQYIADYNKLKINVAEALYGPE